MNHQNSPKKYRCEYCGKEYARAASLEVHTCSKKQRALQKHEKRVRYGFEAYKRFLRLSCGRRDEPTYEEFADSQHYTVFVKFGSYISNVRPLYPEKYIDYVVTSGKRVKDWTNDDLYEKYVIDLVHREPADVALERSLKTMIEWAEKNKSVWNHYFNYVNQEVAVWHIRDGKISPWLVLNTTKGKTFLSKLDDSQLKLIYTVINPDVWKTKFKRSQKDVETVKLLAKEYDL